LADFSRDVDRDAVVVARFDVALERRDEEKSFGFAPG